MRGKLAIGCFVLAVTGRVAVADVVSECRWHPRPEVRMRACTEIITSQSFGPDEKALAYGYRGNAHTNAGAVRPALADFAESIRLKMDNVSAFAGRGRAKLKMGNLPGAIADYSEAIRLSPVSAELYIERGHVYIVRGKADAALRDFTEALRLDPWSWLAFNERGLAFFMKGDLVRAQEDYTAAIAIVQLPTIYANRGYVYEAQGRTKDAIKDLRQALLGDPSLVEARDALKRLGAEQAIPIETDQRVRQGKASAEINCVSCHAVGDTGVSPNKDAPEFRNIYRRHPLYALRQPITRAIRATHDQMPQFMPSDKEIDAIVAYISSFSTTSRLDMSPSAPGQTARWTTKAMSGLRLITDMGF
jgi:tetratricopeptide (TPR) repeat protein